MHMKSVHVSDLCNKKHGFLNVNVGFEYLSALRLCVFSTWRFIRHVKFIVIVSQMPLKVEGHMRDHHTPHSKDEKVSYGTLRLV